MPMTGTPRSIPTKFLGALICCLDMTYQVDYSRER